MTLATGGEGLGSVYVSAVRTVQGGPDAIIVLKATQAVNVSLVR